MQTSRRQGDNEGIARPRLRRRRVSPEAETVPDVGRTASAARRPEGVALRAVTVLLVLAVAFTIPATGWAHRSPELGVAHEIEHMIKDTNLLRADNGKPPFPVDDSFRALSDPAALYEVLGLWSKRFDNQLKKSFWWPLALCESNGNWAMRGKYHGGFSFHPLTWKQYRLKRLPKVAWKATPGEQIRVARRVQDAQGWEAWPYCSKKIGLR